MEAFEKTQASLVAKKSGGLKRRSRLLWDVRTMHLRRRGREMAAKMIEIEDHDALSTEVPAVAEEVHVVVIDSIVDEASRDVISDLSSITSEETIDRTALIVGLCHLCDVFQVKNLG